MFDFDRFNRRVEEIGVTQTYIAICLGQEKKKANYYFRDKKNPKKNKNPFTENEIAIIAKCLWTTPEYLTDETDEKEIPSISEMLSREEKNLLKAWRAAENAKDFEVMDNTAWALRKYGMPMPKKNNTDQQSNSVVK